MEFLFAFQACLLYVHLTLQFYFYSCWSCLHVSRTILLFGSFMEGGHFRWFLLFCIWGKGGISLSSNLAYFFIFFGIPPKVYPVI